MRVKRGTVSRQRHKKILKLAKGFRGTRSKLFKVANQAVMKSLKYAYRDRRNKKRDLRRLWIARINAFPNLNRKLLADLAARDAAAFAILADKVKAAL